MKEYLLFVDETKSTKSNPDFCLSGISVSREYYEKQLIRNINILKKKHFGRTDIVFHFSDMKKNKKEFYILKDDEKRKAFWEEFVQLLSTAPIDILGIYFNENDMSSIYPSNKRCCYDIGFCALLDNYVHYLKEKEAYGQICLESRTFKENSYLQRSFYEYVEGGSLYFSKEDTFKHLTSLGFIIKSDNCVGLQIADVVPSQLLRYQKSIAGDFYNLSKTLCTKIYNYNTNYETILGLKNIL